MSNATDGHRDVKKKRKKNIIIIFLTLSLLEEKDREEFVFEWLGRSLQEGFGCYCGHVCLLLPMPFVSCWFSKTLGCQLENKS